MNVNKKTSCKISSDWCTQRNAIFFSKRRVCGCKCKIGFATYGKDNDSCVKNKNIHEGCSIYSGRGTKPWHPVGMLPFKRNSLLRLTLTTFGSSCRVDTNTSHYFKDGQWVKFKNDALPFQLVKRRLNPVTRNMNGSASANRTAVLYSIKWLTKRKNIAYIKGRLVKIGVVCGGVPKCAVFKVQGKLDSIHCYLATTPTSITLRAKKTPTTTASTSIYTTITTEKTEISTKSTTELTTENAKGTIGSNIAGGHRKSNNNTLNFSIPGAVAGTAVTMALVLVVGIILGYFCKVKKKTKVERRPSTDTLEGTQIHNFGIMNGVYGRNRSISELEDVSSVYSEISNLTNMCKSKPPPLYKELDGSSFSSIRNTNDKLPLPPTPSTDKRETGQDSFEDGLGPALPPTPEYIRKSLAFFPSNSERRFLYPDVHVQSSNDDLKDNFIVSQSEISNNANKLVTPDSHFYEVPVDGIPPSPAYVEPDQLSVSKDDTEENNYFDVII